MGKIIVGGAVLAVIFIIIAIACGGVTFKKCRESKHDDK
jgi:hypothetical protein